MALFRQSEELLISAGFDGLVGVGDCGGLRRKFVVTRVGC